MRKDKGIFKIQPQNFRISYIGETKIRKLIIDKIKNMNCNERKIKIHLSELSKIFPGENEEKLYDYFLYEACKLNSLSLTFSREKPYLESTASLTCGYRVKYNQKECEIYIVDTFLKLVKETNILDFLQWKIGNKKFEKNLNRNFSSKEMGNE